MSLKRIGVCVLAAATGGPTSAVIVEGQQRPPRLGIFGCNVEAPLKGKWGYAKRGDYCEGLLYEPENAAAPFEPYSLMAGTFPAPAVFYRVTWPSVRGPVNIAVSGTSSRQKAKYRLDASVQGPFFDWPTDVLRVAGAKPNVIASTTEIINGLPQTVYLAASVIDPHDDDEPLPQPPRYSFDIGDPGPLKNMAVSLTRWTAAGTPDGAAIPVKLYRTEHESKYTLAGLGHPLRFTLDFTRQPPGLYRVRLTAVDSFAGKPVDHSWLVRPAL